MWHIVEGDRLEKKWRTLPVQVVRKYEMWKSLVRYNGPAILRQFPGFHDEALKGRWRRCRSSRLNIQYRVLYVVIAVSHVVRVADIIPHTY